MSGGDPGFLYPFLDAAEDDPEGLLADLAASARAKATQSDVLAERTLAELDGALDAAARAMAGRFLAGGRLLCFGNGGSATDAAQTASLYSDPPAGRSLPARSLAADTAVLSALANDVGIEVVFARQIMAHGRAGDVALGLSTSGNSANLLAAFAEARRRGLLTVGLAGYRGGRMAGSGDVDHCFVVASESVHRIQEVQDRLLHRLWLGVHEHLRADRVGTTGPAPGAGR